MAPLVFLAFIIIPVLEIAVFIELGGKIGLWSTIGLIIATAFIGTWLLRAQGIRTLQRAQESMDRNVFPTGELFEGICLLVAGLLLLTPGFVTDAVGFLLLVPPVRRIMGYWFWGVIAKRVHGTVHVNTGGSRDFEDGTIEGEFRDVTPEDQPKKDGPERLPPRRD